MAYSKQTWDTTSYVNPTRMNHIEQGIYDAQETADSKSNLITEKLLENHFISTASTWDSVNLIGNIDNYEYLGFSFAGADKSATQGIMKAIIPVSTFKTSDTNSPIAIIEDYYNPSDSRALFVCFNSTTSILRYRGSDIYMYHRLSVFGIGKKS